MAEKKKGNSSTGKEIEKAVWFYYDSGFSIIPLRERSKKPNIDQWKQFQKRRPTRGQIQTWLNDKKFKNIGILTGNISGGLIVFDLDDSSLKEILDITPWEIWDNGAWIAQTGGEGRYHIYILNSEKCHGIIKPIGYGIEYRGNGGYVVAYPSIHPNEEKYNWDDKPHIPEMDDWENQPLPKLVPIDANSLWDKWIKRIEEHKGITQQNNTSLEDTPHCIREIIKGVPEGQRDTVAYGYATHLKDQGLTRDGTLKKLLAWNKNNTPPLDDRQIREKVQSAFKDDKTTGCTYWRNHGYCTDPQNCIITKQKKEIVTRGHGEKRETSLVITENHGTYILYEEIITPGTRETCFINERGDTYQEITLDGVTYHPIPGNNEAITQGLIHFPTGTLDYGTTKELIENIQAHIHKYVEIGARFEKIASWYILFTYIYDRVDVTPYLRTRGDTGTGKSRFQDVIGGLCYKPMFTAGAVTPAVMYRLINRYRGTLIIDEADWYKSTESSEIIKILNCGFQRKRPVTRCQMDNPDNLQVFDTYCPKILSTRKDFNDKATENRCLTHINKEMTRNNIPINLPSEFHREQEILRNKCLQWRLDHYNKINPDLARTFDLGKKLSPRLRQVMENFPLLFHNDPEMMQFFRETLLELNNELKEERAISPNGILVNSFLSLVDTDTLHITAGDIAREMKTTHGMDWVTPQWVGKHLKSLALETDTPRKIQGETKRCIKLETKIIEQLRMRYQIDTGENRENISTLDDYSDTHVTTPPTGEKVTKVTKVTSHRGTKGGIPENIHIDNTDTISHPSPHTHVTNVTHVTQQEKKWLHVPASITLEKTNGNTGHGTIPHCSDKPGGT